MIGRKIFAAFRTKQQVCCVTVIIDFRWRSLEDELWVKLFQLICCYAHDTWSCAE